MEVTRNALPACCGALPPVTRGERAAADVVLRVSCQQYSPRCTLGGTRRPRTGCWPGPSTSQTDRGAQVAGLEPCCLSGTRLFLGASFPSPGRPCPRGCSGGGSLPPPAPLPARPLGHTLNLHPLEVFPVKAQPQKEKPTDLCTDVEMRRQEELPEHGLAEPGWPWAWASSC